MILDPLSVLSCLRKQIHGTCSTHWKEKRGDGIRDTPCRTLHDRAWPEKQREEIERTDDASKNRAGFGIVVNQEI